MSATGHIHTKNVSLRIWNGDGASLGLSAHGNTTDIDYNADDLEATAYGDQAHTFLAGLTNFTIAVTGWWAGSHATDVSDSVAACIFNMVGASVGGMIQVNPSGSTAGSLAYAACVNFQAAPMSFPADNIATMNFTCTARAGSLSASTDSIW
jgi:hypothetical protein